MSKQPKFIDYIICDDIREETNNKRTYVGVYKDDITVDKVPYRVPQFCLSTKWDMSKATFKEIILRIEMPDGKQIGPIKATRPKEKLEGKRLLYIVFSPFEFSSIGTYKLYYKIDAGEEKGFGQFEVKLSSD